MTSDKELIEQLAKSHAFSFWQVPKIGYTYSFTEAQLEAFAKAYAQTQGQKLIKTVYECTNCGYWYIGHTVSQCDCMPDKQEFRTMEVFTYEQTAAPIESGVNDGNT